MIADIAPAQIVGEDEQDVRPLGGGHAAPRAKHARTDGGGEPRRSKGAGAGENGAAGRLALGLGVGRVRQAVIGHRAEFP